MSRHKYLIVAPLEGKYAVKWTIGLNKWGPGCEIALSTLIRILAIIVAIFLQFPLMRVIYKNAFSLRKMQYIRFSTGTVTTRFKMFKVIILCALLFAVVLCAPNPGFSSLAGTNFTLNHVSRPICFTQIWPLFGSTGKIVGH